MNKFSFFNKELYELLSIICNDTTLINRFIDSVKVLKLSKVIIRIQESHEGMAALTDLESLILLPSKARTIVHVLDKQCG